MLLGICMILVAATLMTAVSQGSITGRAAQERLSFQVSGPWNPRIQIDADVAMVYGIDSSLPQRIETWRRRGYRIHVMTGVSWGQYQDYLYGRFDGANHEDEAQTDRNGRRISHGGDVYYMCPGESYGRFLSTGVQRALDAGAEAIHLEEPEFWVQAGYSEGFKREWKKYYKEDWQPPHASPDAQYRASQLKYYLYRRALAQVFAFVKDYARQHDRTIRCYVPSHSLINYAHWRIVSPESSLLEVGCDGYIAQVWTGTARTPNYYEGVLAERTFETAFLEYGAMGNLVRASGRTVWFLNDPIEDNPDHSWQDYRRNWESTLTASLLRPEVWRYEVLPWPERIFQEKYPVKDISNRRPGEPVEKEPIPKTYETELQTVFHALGEMRQPADSVRWLYAGTGGAGVLVSDTMMFQRGEPSPSDPHLGSFYGLAMPLLKHGLAVEPVQIEAVALKGDFLSNYRLLLLTYEGQKPPTPAFHEVLAEWVKGGGALVVVDDDTDPYLAVRAWWNTAPYSYRTPREHLFERLGLPADFTGTQRVGKGVVVRESASPAAMTYQRGGADRLRELARQAAEAIRLEWRESNALVLQRGPYVIVAGLAESRASGGPVKLSGRFVDLFDSKLSVLDGLTVTADKRALLYDLSCVKQKAELVAAACNVRDLQIASDAITFRATGIDETQAVVCLVVSASPREISVDGKPLPAEAWDYSGGVVRVHFDNSADGASIVIRR